MAHTPELPAFRLTYYVSQSSAESASAVIHATDAKAAKRELYRRLGVKRLVGVRTETLGDGERS